MTTRQRIILLESKGYEIRYVGRPDGGVRIKEIESALKQAHQLASTTDWISTGQHRFRLGMSSGRRTLDRKGLAQELAHIFHEEGLDHIDVDALFQRHEQEGKPVARLSITPIH